ncbi:MAG TPA: Hsp70 family protein [Thiotrichales bacterium]|nr:Hsp70 family protein [Thiotrichales bacterium]
MAGERYTKMAVDFGTSNTVVAFWDEGRGDVRLHAIPDVTRPFRFRMDGVETEIPYVPSAIYYHGHERLVGFQVLARALEESRGAFRWMKAYIRDRRRIERDMGGGLRVDHYRAGRDFLENVLLYASEHIDFGHAEVAFTVPVESFEHYTDWLGNVCREVGVRRYRFIDESSACIFGYDTHLQTGDVFVIFDFGGGTLDVSVVRIEDHVSGGRGCRVLGKAGCDIGGRTIDAWLYQALLQRAGISDLDARPASGLFLLQVEALKERLSTEAAVDYDIRHDASGLRLSGRLQRTEFEDLLEERGLYTRIQETLERALRTAEEKGIPKSDIKETLLVGGTSQIPSIRRQVRMHFGERTRGYRPYDAVARGACRYLTSDIEALYDHIQHDYAIRDYDPRAGRHRFHTLVEQGTPYPTEPDFKRLTLKAVREGQRFFGINIYEVAEAGSAAVGGVDLVFDASGNMVLDTREKRIEAETEYWMNEDRPTFIEAVPPANKGDKRFLVSFRVDDQKHLLVTVFDILTQKHVYRDHPVVKLK